VANPAGEPLSFTNHPQQLSKRMNTSVTTRLQRFSSIEILESRIAPATLFAVDATGKLISFDSESPAMITSKAITGLNAAETIRGIDFRPATGELYGLGITDLAGDDEARLYVLNPATGAATLVGPGAFATLPDGLSYGFDFNPVVDRIRVVASNDLNFRLNPNTGGLVAFDTPLDNAAAAEQVVGSAYDRNFDGASATTLFGIDFPTNSLVRQGSINASPQSPNGGAITTIGALGVTLDSRNVGFDIESRTGTAYASLEVGGSTGLYSVNLTTGAATSLGSIGNTAPLLAFAGRAANGEDHGWQDGDVYRRRRRFGNGEDLQGYPERRELSVRHKGGRFSVAAAETSGADEFGGTNIAITAKPLSGGGSGFVNVGFIDATGVDLGNVSVAGDLGRIQAGDANTATTGLAALTTLSMGVAGTSTQLPGGNLESSVRGPVGKLVVKGDIERAAIGVTGINLADGSIGKVVIGGSIFGGSLDNAGSIITSGSVAKIVVKGNLVGSFGELSGAIQVGGSSSSVVVGGSLIGGAGEGSGSLFSTGSLGKVKVGGSVSGAAGEFSGAIFAEKNLATVQIGEHLRGGAGVFSGSVGHEQRRSRQSNDRRLHLWRWISVAWDLQRTHVGDCGCRRRRSRLPQCAGIHRRAWPGRSD
jgi:hypothetical protein